MRRDKKLTDVHAHMEQYTSGELESVLRGADEAGADNFVAVTLANQSSTLNVGADLTVDSATASLGDNQTIGYRISVNFN